VLAITGIEIAPTATATDAETKRFEEQPIVTGGTPSATTAAWCVAVEPIDSGKIGRVAIGGVVQLKAADLDKATGAEVLWKDSNWALIRLSSGGGVIRGTFSGTWTKGSTTTVTDALVSGATYTAKNYIATLSGSACLIAYVADEWVLVGWDWHSMTGYSASKQQVLTHAANGGLAWIDTTACT
jgi:predicted RecA/RadA family phage recombinase